MSTRIVDLKPAAHATGTKLYRSFGNLKQLLSAAVLAFDWLPDDQQKLFMRLAEGSEEPLPTRAGDAQRAADLFWNYLPPEIQEMLVKAVRGEGPLDTRWLEMTRTGLEKGLAARQAKLQPGRGSKGRQRGP